MAEDYEIKKETPVIFIHRVDTYLGKILAQHLGTSVPGSTSADYAKTVEKPLLSPQEFFEAPTSPECFQVIGSCIPPQPSADIYEEPVLPLTLPALQSTIPSNNEVKLIRVLDVAEIYVFHVVDENGENGLLEDTQRVISLAEKHITENKLTKSIILISSLMSWGKIKVENTKKNDAEVKDEREVSAFTETEYKKRRAHANFKAYLDLEKKLTAFARKYKKRVSATVIGSGILYGMGENFLHQYFKDAWNNKSTLSVPGDGKNHLLMIHAQDLAQVVQNVVDLKSRNSYLIAVDEGNHTLQGVVMAISKELTTGEVTNISIEDALNQKLFSRFQIDCLTTDLFLEATSIKENMKLNWVAADGFIPARRKVTEEFRLLRDLIPIKLNVLGPPSSGKSTLCKKIADFYKIHYVRPENIVEQTVEELRRILKIAEKQMSAVPVTAENAQVEEKAEDKPTDQAGQIRRLLGEIEIISDENEGKVTDDLIVRLVRKRLMSRPCNNQGYILDGFPSSKEIAVKLFAPIERMDDDDDEFGERFLEEDESEGIPPHEKKLIPDFVFYLNVPEEHLLKRRMLEPDILEIETVSTTVREHFTSRMTEQKVAKKDGNTALDFYDEIENYPIWVSSANSDALDEDDMFMQILHRVGKPRNYGFTVAEKVALIRGKEAEMIQKSVEIAERSKIMQKRVREETNLRSAEWQRHLDLLRAEDYARRELREMPAHQYLLKYVLPTIHESLLECAKILPNDPIDFVAEYLLQKCRTSMMDLDVYLPKDRGDNISVDTQSSDATIAEGEIEPSKVENTTTFISETAHFSRLIELDIELEDIKSFVFQTAHVFPDLISED